MGGSRWAARLTSRAVLRLPLFLDAEEVFEVARDDDEVGAVAIVVAVVALGAEMDGNREIAQSPKRGEALSLKVEEVLVFLGHDVRNLRSQAMAVPALPRTIDAGEVVSYGCCETAARVRLQDGGP